jgi:hypothetical protein
MLVMWLEFLWVSVVVPVPAAQDVAVVVLGSDKMLDIVVVVEEMQVVLDHLVLEVVAELQQ